MSRIFYNVKFYYPLVMLGLGFCHQMIAQWLVFFYSPPPSMGMTAYLEIGKISIVMVLGRVMDALSNPVVAYFSDRSSSRYGRRKPFMFLGSIFLILTFLFIWRPPVEGTSEANFYWASVLICIFFFMYSCVAVPYLALLPEIFQEDELRIKLAVLQTVFYGAGAGLGFIIPITLGAFMDFQAISLYLMPLVVFSLLPPSLLLKENPRRAGAKPLFQGWLSAWSSLKSESLLLYWVITQAFTWAALIILVTILPYLGTVILKIKSFYDLYLPAMAILITGSTAGVFIVFKNVKKIGKEKVYRISLFLMSIILALFSLLGIFSGNVQLHAALLFALIAGPLSLLITIPNAMVADISDYHKSLNREGREAMLYAVQGFIVKLSMAGGTALMGYILFLSEQNISAGIRFSFLAAGGLFFLSTFFFHRFLKLRFGNPIFRNSI